LISLSKDIHKRDIQKRRPEGRRMSQALTANGWPDDLAGQCQPARNNPI